MLHILPRILSLCQYQFEMDHKPEQLRPDKCAFCGRAHPWHHAQYSRKSDRTNKPGESLNPIVILRYYCPGCRRTTSALPECIPPRRWYLWEIQQSVFVLFLLGKSAYAIAKETIPTHQTISRWMVRFREQFILHKDILCVRLHALGRTSGLTDFWMTCFEKITLGESMRLCHDAAVFIP